EANNFKDIKGVMPYLAPELLSGRDLYSQATDVYAFGMIMWEISSHEKPFGQVDHDIQLALSIVKDLRPEITKDTPPFYRDLMQKCWHSDPMQRPSAEEIYQLTESWRYKPISKIKDQISKANMIRTSNMLIKNKAKTSHPGAIYKSRLVPNISKG